MRVHVFVVESERPNSPTSIRTTYGNVQTLLAKAGTLGRGVFVDAPTKKDVIEAAATFSAWTGTLPPKDPIVLWPSIHGANPEPGVPDDKRKLVGTSGASAAKERVHWQDVFSPVKQAQDPSRVVILMDVCWGASPTAPRSLTLPPETRPALVFGPARSANRTELDAASHAILGHISKYGIPDVATAKQIVDTLNSKFKPAKTGTSFYRVWWWDATGMHRHPEPASKIKRKA